ncbi:hypothetical protein BDQ17DRAFT_1411690 [Cyathus striatus]|nr:hypothetical protein BDQ17DRAFT_1411690 [Cyathus striatus]
MAILISDSDSDIDTIQVITYEKPPLKKQKYEVTSADIFGKRDAVGQLAGMPKDLWLEIFSQLEPLDLISLSRTSKSLRKFLMAESSSNLWRGAQENMDGVPVCPEGISEQGYTALLFESHCHKCLSSTRNVCWDLRARLCEECLKSDVRFIERAHCHSKRFVDICPVFLCSSTDGRARTFYYKPFLTKARSRFDRLNDEAKAQWLRAETKKTDAIRVHASGCQKFLDKFWEHIIRLRVDDILKRLTDLGWLEVIDYIPDIKGHPLVSKQEKLTEHIWDDILPKLTAFLEMQNAVFFEKIQFSRLRSRVTVLAKFHESYTLIKPINTVIPPPAALFLFKPIHDLIMNTPKNVELTVDNLKEVAEGLEHFCTRWKKDKDLQLLKMILKRPPNKGELENAESILTLATSAFQCDVCNHNLDRSQTPYYSSSSRTSVNEGSYIRYPRILMHEHFSHPHLLGEDKQYPEHLDPVFQELLSGLWSPWTRTFRGDGDMLIHWSSFYHTAARTVILASGLDISIASITDMDRLDPILQCTVCKPKKNEMFMTWRMTISHLAMHNSKWNETTLADGTKPKLARCKLVICEATVKRVKDKRLESFLQEYSNKQNEILNRRRFICKICRFRSTAHDMKKHLLEEHNKATINIKDVMRHIDEPEDNFCCQLPPDIFGLYKA